MFKISGISKLAESLRIHAGGEVYLHNGAEKVNDLRPGDEKCYTRGVWNLKPEWVSTYYSHGLPFAPAARETIDGKKIITYLRDQYRSPELCLQFDTHNARSNEHDVMANSLYCQILGLEGEDTKTEMQDEPYTDVVHTPLNGMLGKLGLTTSTSVEKMRRVPKEVKVRTYQPIKLDTFLLHTSNPNGNAYAMRLEIPVWVNQTQGKGSSIGRGIGYPELTIISGKSLVEDTASYLLSQPDDYFPLIKGLLPESEFPTINRGFFNQEPTERTEYKTGKKRGIYVENRTTGESFAAP